MTDPATWYPMSVTMKSCFHGLGEGLATHLDDPNERLLFDYHHHRIASIFANRSALLADQDAIAGFLNGFLTAIARFVPNDSVEQESTFPVLGGIYLTGVAAVGESAERDGREFIAQLAATLEPSDFADALELANAMQAVRAIFATTPDVPIDWASLAGFALGVLYAGPYVPPDSAGIEYLFAATTSMAQALDT